MGNQAVEDAIKIKACKWWLLVEFKLQKRESNVGARNIYGRRNEAKPAQWAMLVNRYTGVG